MDVIIAFGLVGPIASPTKAMNHYQVQIKIQKVKDYNAARRQDSKESLKSITKDKEEFGKNYRAMSAGTLKMLERTLK